MRNATLLALVWSVLNNGVALATEYTATPDDYRDKVTQLKPGDTLRLAPGTYEHQLNITNLNGAPDAWITITGPEEGEPAIFVADPGPCCNTIEIRNSSYVAIRHITVDGRHVPGAFGLSAKDGESNRVHHIRVEHCTFVNHDGSQQTVAISTKTPTWGWEIRHNVIRNAGTGMYLGNSNGTQPFFAAIIEYNLIEDTIGYNLQIKWQLPRPSLEGMPQGPSRTIIRHNVFIKTDRESPDGDRPNLLVGGFPDSGPGSEDLYEIYGNVFYHNPRESLLQASGRVSIHDNVFVDVAGTAILLRNHDLPLRLAHVYNNTIYAAQTGINVASDAVEESVVVGNLIFAEEPLRGQPDVEADNVTDAVANADQYVTMPSTTLGEMDFYPVAGSPARGTPVDLSRFSDQTEWNLDFNSMDKGDFSYRGAYAGEGQNPGWAIDDAIKETPSEDATDSTDTGEGTDTGGGTDTDDSTDGDDGTPSGDDGASAGDGGCGCSTPGTSDGDEPWLWVWAIAAVLAFRKRWGQHAISLTQQGTWGENHTNQPREGGM